jgi:hypothetical protein
MAFTIDPRANDRPLGFAAAIAPAGGESGATAGAVAGSASPLLAWIAVTRQSGERPGAAAAALLPPTPPCSALNRFNRAQLERSAALLRGVAFVRAGQDEAACARIAAAVAKSAGVTNGTVALVPCGEAEKSADANAAGRMETAAPLPDLGWLAHADAPLLASLPATIGAGLPTATASTRGIVDGQLVSVVGFASGRLRAGPRSAWRVTLLTDARVESATLERLLHEATQRAWATLAGTTRPEGDDGVLGLASGVAGSEPLALGSIGFETLRVATTALLQSLGRELLEQAWSPRPARLVQVTIVGARDAVEAAAKAEELAADPALARWIEDEEARSQRRPRFTVRRTPDERQAAVSVDLAAGPASATRWVALPR